MEESMNKGRRELWVIVEGREGRIMGWKSPRKREGRRREGMVWNGMGKVTKKGPINEEVDKKGV